MGIWIVPIRENLYQDWSQPSLILVDRNLSGIFNSIGFYGIGDLAVV